MTESHDDNDNHNNADHSIINIIRGAGREGAARAGGAQGEPLV